MKALKIIGMALALVLIVNIAAPIAFAAEVQPVFLYEEGVRREPILAGVMSFFIPGLGQFYNGENSKATKHLLFGLGGYVLGGVLAPFTFGLGTLLPLAVCIWSSLDAYRTANTINTNLGY